jgi:acetyl-CoA decarbonylase/synthase complex subunit delta
VPAEWGDFETRAVIWEISTAITLLQSGADIVTLRHPAAIDRVKQAIDELMSAGIPDALAAAPAI